MKKISFVLIGIGLLCAAFFAWADSLGLGGDEGIGAMQLLGIQVGVAVMLVGIGLATVKWGEDANSRLRFRFSSVQNFPTLYWLLVTFLVTYILFFLLPVFFSKLQIHYLTKYIPDAYITHIGFDIEAIVSRIENWLRTGQSPYSDGFIAYPPLTIAVFATFSIIGYPAYFKLIVSITLLAYLISGLVLQLLSIPKRNQILLPLFFITGLFSYGLQFEQERGQFNLITFTICLIAIYIFHFHCKYRFFAYLLFSLSIQLKIYPVFFIFMFVDDWAEWKGILKRFLSLGLFNFSLLFILGRNIFFDFLHVITAYQFEYQSTRVENLSVEGFKQYLLSNSVQTILPLSAQSIKLIGVFFLILLAFCFIFVLGRAIKKQETGLNPYLLLISTIAALIIPSVSNDYKLSILVAPMTLVICGLPEITKPEKKAYSILLVILASLAYWTTLYPATVKPEYLGRNFPALIVILVSTTILNFLAPYSYERNRQEINNIPEPGHE